MQKFIKTNENSLQLVVNKVSNSHKSLQYKVEMKLEETQNKKTIHINILGSSVTRTDLCEENRN